MALFLGLDDLDVGVLLELKALVLTGGATGTLIVDTLDLGETVDTVGILTTGNITTSVLSYRYVSM